MHKAGRTKRPRALQACEVCRARKNRCSEDQPCTYCVEHDLECTYSRIHRDKRRRPRRPISWSSQPVTGINSPAFTAVPSLLNDVNQGAETLETATVQQLDSLTVNQAPHEGATSALPTMDGNSCTTSTVTPQSTVSDVRDTNSQTSSVEFYGAASSVAFLRHVEMLPVCQSTGSLAVPPERPLAVLLHSTAFQPDTSQVMVESLQEPDLNTDRFHFRVAKQFIDAYFSNIHHIQPLFEEEVFLARCEDLWFNRPGKQPLSFVALYYAILSLGSLVMALETPEIAGADRFTWSRKLFNDALVLVTRLGTATDVEMVHCFYMMSKICQHELNPHVAYLYSGQAARTALAIGINRKPTGPDAADRQASTVASKTWWAVYCLDIQTSFALGRPDSLGPDQYHTQDIPTATPDRSYQSPHLLQIVPCMVSLSRIMRKVALDLYAQPNDLGQKLHRAKALDAELEHWLEQVPSHLRSECQSDWNLRLKPRRLASYIKKQSVVLRLRYLNLRMVIHAVFITDMKTVMPDEATFLRACQCRCIQSAEDSIALIYSTFCKDDYFQTWWYNTTYTLFAVSILLTVVFRQLARTQQELEALLTHIDRAIAVLQSMDDCSVARNATAIIKRTLVRAKKVPQSALAAQQSSSPGDADLSSTLNFFAEVERPMESESVDTLLETPAMGDSDLGEAVGDFDWLNTCPIDDGQQAVFWTEWANGIETLGT